MSGAPAPGWPPPRPGWASALPGRRKPLPDVHCQHRHYFKVWGLGKPHRHAGRGWGRCAPGRLLVQVPGEQLRLRQAGHGRAQQRARRAAAALQLAQVQHDHVLPRGYRARSARCQAPQESSQGGQISGARLKVCCLSSVCTYLEAQTGEVGSGRHAAAVCWLAAHSAALPAQPHVPGLHPSHCLTRSHASARRHGKSASACTHSVFQCMPTAYAWPCLGKGRVEAMPGPAGSASVARPLPDRQAVINASVRAGCASARPHLDLVDLALADLDRRLGRCDGLACGRLRRRRVPAAAARACACAGHRWAGRRARTALSRGIGKSEDGVPARPSKHA
jgi:hypothetical protein